MATSKTSGSKSSGNSGSRGSRGQANSGSAVGADARSKAGTQKARVQGTGGGTRATPAKGK